MIDPDRQREDEVLGLLVAVVRRSVEAAKADGDPGAALEFLHATGSWLATAEPMLASDASERRNEGRQRVAQAAFALEACASVSLRDGYALRAALEVFGSVGSGPMPRRPSAVRTKLHAFIALETRAREVYDEAIARGATLPERQRIHRAHLWARQAIAAEREGASARAADLARNAARVIEREATPAEPVKRTRKRRIPKAG